MYMNLNVVFVDKNILCRRVRVPRFDIIQRRPCKSSLKYSLPGRRQLLTTQYNNYIVQIARSIPLVPSGKFGRKFTFTSTNLVNKFTRKRLKRTNYIV